MKRIIKTPTQSFCGNSGKCGSLLTFFPPELTCSKSFYIGFLNGGFIFPSFLFLILTQLLSNPLQHYFAKFQCSSVQFYTETLFKSEMMRNRLFTVNICHRCNFHGHMSVQIKLQYYMVCWKCPPSAHMLWVMHLTGQLMRRWRVVQRCDKSLSLYHNCDSTTIRLRSDYDVSRTPASNSTQAKNEHVNFSS